MNCGVCLFRILVGPPYQQQLNRQTEVSQPKQGIFFFTIVQEHLNIGWENKDQQENDAPGSQLSCSRNKKQKSQYQLQQPRNEYQEGWCRKPERHDSEINFRMDRMIDTGHHIEPPHHISQIIFQAIKIIETCTPCFSPIILAVPQKFIAYISWKLLLYFLSWGLLTSLFI